VVVEIIPPNSAGRSVARIARKLRFGNRGQFLVCGSLEIRFKALGFQRGFVIFITDLRRFSGFRVKVRNEMGMTGLATPGNENRSGLGV
jgi:hypothetical protein